MQQHLAPQGGIPFAADMVLLQQEQAEAAPQPVTHLTQI